MLPHDLVVEGLQRLNPVGRIGALLDPDPSEPFAKITVLEATQYMRNQLLRDTDWSSMAHSVEVRVPLVDTELLARMAPLVVRSRPGSGKRLLAQAPQKPLPPEMLLRPKTGFSTPSADWLKSSADLGIWWRNTTLANDPCPWARRLAYAVASQTLDLL